MSDSKGFQMVPPMEQQQQQQVMGPAPAVGSGTDPAITTMVPNVVQTVHNVSFFKSDSIFATNPDRKYFKVLENGIEANFPYGVCCYGLPAACNCVFPSTMGDPGCGLFFPSNICCPYMDHMNKFYYDRGIYETRCHCGDTLGQLNMYRLCGCIRGDPEIFAGEIKYICCRQDCCDCFNNFLNCYSTDCCGERIRLKPCTTWCCCLGNTTDCCDNCYCLLGPKEGQPKCMIPLLSCLAIGESQKLQDSMNISRLAWKQRAGIP